MSELDAGAIRPMAVTAERDRNRYLRSESAFDVLKKALRIYRQHFGLLQYYDLRSRKEGFDFAAMDEVIKD